MFNIYNIDNQEYLDYVELMCIGVKQLELETVPIIDNNFVLNHTIDELLVMADGHSVVNPAVLREGLVFRAKTNKVVRGLSRFSFKAVSNKFLLKFEE